MSQIRRSPRLKMNSPRHSPRVTRSTTSLYPTNLTSMEDEIKVTDSSDDEYDNDSKKNDEQLEALKKSKYLAQVSTAKFDNTKNLEPTSFAGQSSSSSSGKIAATKGVPHLGDILTRKPLPSQKPKPTVSDKNDTFKYIGVAAVMVLIAAVMGWYFLRWRHCVLKSELPSPEVSFEEAFDKQLARLKVNYPSQNTKTWRTIRAAVLPAGLNPTSPGVLAALATEQASGTSACLTSSLAQAVSDAYNDSGYVRLNGARYLDRQNDVAGVKKELDKVIRSSLGASSGQQHVILMERVDLLPAKSGLLFHGLCDNEMAPFKRAVYIFTSRLDEGGAKLVDMQVTGAWEGHLSEDQRSSIESRIGNHIIDIVPEPADKLAGVCR